MTSTILRFLLLFALLLLGHASAHAQSPADTATAVVTDFTGLEPGAPMPADPRYAQAADLTELKAQLQNLVQAYNQLVTRYNAQSEQLQQLVQQQAPAGNGRSRLPRPTTLASGGY